MTRRDYLELMAASAAATVTTNTLTAAGGDADREARMKWWHEARFGMFIHWGLYSVLGRHEWVMENEGIPVAEYEQIAKRFKPKPNAARDWAKLAKASGQKYMVVITMYFRPEVHGDDHQTPRGLLPLRFQTHRLLRPQARPRPRPRQGVRRSRPRRGLARGLLLFAHGLAPSRWRPLRHR